MAQTWKYAIGLGLLGGALATGCVVKSGGDDIGEAGESGTGGTTGGSGGTTGGSSGKGGSAGKGGSGGSAGGSAGNGGTGGATGGSAGSGGGRGGSAGAGGSTGGDAGSGGTTGGSAGTGGDGGTGGLPTEEDTVPECDPATGNLDNTPYPDCEPSNTEDPTCEECIKENCCEESMACYSFAPGNVCGWGGPTSGDYAGAGEIGCYVACLADYVDEMGVCDGDGIGECIGTCQTTMCGDVLGTQTSDLAACIHTSCNQACLGIETCE